MFKLWMAGSALALLASAPAWADGPIRASEGIGYYVAVDGSDTITYGAYTGLSNPNEGRLTFLFDHGNHFHGLGAYSYTGPADSAVETPTNSNNHLPELYSRIDDDTSALLLVAGSGDFAGSLVSSTTGNTANEEYGYLGIASIHSLDGYSPEADVLYTSSAGSYAGRYDDITVGLQLESISSGLSVAAGGMTDIFGASSVYTLGSLNDFTFMPTFYVDDSAAAGIYSASFTLVNLSSGSPILSSGEFHYDFAVAAPVPEPEMALMLTAGLGLISLVGRRRKR